MTTIVKDKLRKEVKIDKKKGRPEDDLYFEEQFEAALGDCIIGTEPKQTKEWQAILNTYFKEKGYQEVLAWHTIKKYLDRKERQGILRSYTIGRSKCFFMEHKLYEQQLKKKAEREAAQTAGEDSQCKEKKSQEKQEQGVNQTSSD
jgi:GR25 family glycosyltransferase involved in LPS biosynthesis